MNTQIKTSLLALALLSTLNPQLSTLFAQGTAFTYQGRLNDNGAAATGVYDLEFRVFDALAAGGQQGSLVTVNDLGVTNGLFTVTLNPGAGVFTGAARWLNVAVRPGASAGSYANVVPRQPITPTPYAIYSANAGNATAAASATTATTANSFTGSLAGDVTGTQGANVVSSVGGQTAANVAGGASAANAATSANTPNTIVKRAASGNFAAGAITATSVTGDGSALTALNASQLASGTVPAAALGNAWRIGGNAGTTPGTHFLGTTDNQALQLQVNNTVALRITPGVTLPNIVGGLAAYRPSVIASGVSGAVIAGGNAPSGGVDGYGGGDFQAVYDDDGTVGGGFGNKVGNANGDVTDAAFATVAGGVFNTSAGYAATVAGGDSNLADGARAAVLGGYANRAGSAASAVGGGLQNTVQSGADYSTVGGGNFNRILGNSPISTIAGGQYNLISSNSPYATIGGGTNNSIGEYSDHATIAGGGLNTMPYFALGGTISGGIANQMSSGTYESVIGGGYVNHIYDNADTSVIGGGYANEVRGARGVVPGGSYNKANGANSFAAGYAARALHAGCFVWSDPTGDFLFPPGVSSTGDNQFVIRATGGVQLDSATSLFCGSQTRQMLNLWGTQYGIGVQGYTMYFRTDGVDPINGFSWYKGGVHNDAYANAGGGVELMHLIDGGLYVHGTFNNTSDRNAKENFATVVPADVLGKVIALPITRWNYKHDPATPHLGPVAQDFHAAFGVGPDDKHIATVDESGVALAAIQGLNQKVDSETATLRAENAELKQRLEKVERLMNQRNGGAK